MSGQDFEFTPQYCGVSHLKIKHAIFQFTIEQYGADHHAKVIHKPTFSATAERTFTSNEEAEQWLIAQAKALIQP